MNESQFVSNQRASNRSLSDEKVAPAAVLHALMQTIEARKAASPDESYVARLLNGGSQPIIVKIFEEAGELAEAAELPAEARAKNAVHEAADLVFHTLVLLGWADVSLHDVENELARRFGTSGLREKAMRAEN